MKRTRPATLKIIVPLPLALFMLGCEPQVVVPGLYGYVARDEGAVAKRAGLKWAPSDLRRNSDGSRLYCHHAHGDKAILVLSQDLRWKVLKAPAAICYLNDAGQFVAWSDQIYVGFHLLNGRFISTAWSGGHQFGDRFGVDPGGRFFFVATSPERTTIAEVSAPETVLAQSAFQGDRLFLRGSRLYLLGCISEGDSCGKEILGDVFEPARDTWRRVRSFRISRRGGWGPSPFRVEDMDPSADRVLVVDVYDTPFSNRYYLYDIETGHITRVSAQGVTWLLFLKENLLRDAMSRNDEVH